jgi:hypothetical protein
MDPKSQVNDFMMKTLQRPVKKIDDFKYITYGVPAGFQTVLALSCFGGRSYLGEVCANRKEAEQSAAIKALTENTARTLPNKKRKKTQEVHCQCHGQGQGEGAEEEFKLAPEIENVRLDDPAEEGSPKGLSGNLSSGTHSMLFPQMKLA